MTTDLNREGHEGHEDERRYEGFVAPERCYSTDLSKVKIWRWAAATKPGDPTTFLLCCYLLALVGIVLLTAIFVQ